ncbi:MAG: PilZ domain-containing protein [Tindallia sp. MSAO_Bac2]|nr:MAG: PilZ domain-containing protein [Tindallia sp. MSAO_Bac2]
MADKRKATRIEFHIKGVITGKTRQVSGKVNDLSLKGLFLEADTSTDKLTVGEEVAVQIELSDSPSNIKISAEGTIVRLEDNGIGVQLDHIDLDSFTHLKNIISYNVGDHDKVMDEFINSMYEKD